MFKQVGFYDRSDTDDDDRLLVPSLCESVEAIDRVGLYTTTSY